MSDTMEQAPVTDPLPSHADLRQQVAAVPAEAVAAAQAMPANGDPLEQLVVNLQTRLVALEAAIHGTVTEAEGDAKSLMDRVRSIEHALTDLAGAFPKLTTLAAHFGPLARLFGRT